MASTEMVTVLEECRVSPPSSTAVDEKSLPLTFFDIPWIHQHLVQSVFFYEYPHPKTHFIETTIPALKHSLSLTLKHFYPFAGNLLFPPNLGKPQIHYADGDSVSLTFVESSDDFSYLTANHQRDVARLHPLIPQMPPVSVSNDTLVAPLVAIQVTLFPNSGEESMTLEGAILPFYDRTMVKDSNGPSPSSATQKMVMVQCPKLPHVSSLTVACGYTWACVAKARARSSDEVDENELQHFVFPVDCRARLNPPLPENYFALGKTLQNEEGVLRGAEKWLSDLESLNKERTLGVSASPKFAVYNIDFGFGRLQKREMISIDETNSISLHEGKTNMGDIEVGVALPKMTMDVFASIFANGLKVYD
ncbi:Anthocyanin 5-aromatic acyltransferase [Vitis vinifera]|uniref:Anthocyanin 5-aromatic acyltransferase n=1 Tax=Vitis vinifera TaxID=29760 RepID=A0A438IEE6_VITVI|nr:Anthocyanin 5-aromatic acyltransferase [Vitis vinifera]